MSRLLVTTRRLPVDVERRRRPGWPIDPELEQDEWHDHHVDVWVEAPFGTAASGLLAQRGNWLVAFSGWVTTADVIDVPLTAAEVAVRLDRNGTGLLTDLAGEYLLFALHTSSRRWWLVRDAGGVQSGLWAQGRDVLALGTGAGDVAAAADLPSEPDVGYLTMLLAWGPSPGTDTPLNGLTRLPGGQIMQGTAGQATAPTIWTWWAPPPPGSQPEPTVDELRDVYRRVLRGRILAVGPKARITVELSGGLDSTLLAALAREIVTDDRLFALTVVHEGKGAIDLPYARIAARALELDLLEVPWVPRSVEQIEAECEGGARLPDPSNGFSEHFNVARLHKSGVLLSGVGGDQWLGGSGSVFSDLILTGHPWAAVRDVAWGTPIQQWPRLAVSVAKELSAAALGSGVRTALRHQRLRRASPWVPADLLSQHGVAARLHTPRAPLGQTADFEGRWRLTNGWELFALEYAQHWAAQSGVERAVPFWNRLTIESALALNEQARWRRGDWRALSRVLLPSRVPREIRERTDKAEFSALFVQEEVSKALGSVITWRITDCGCTRQDMVQKCLHRMQAGDPMIWPEWCLSAAEYVLRQQKSLPQPMAARSISRMTPDRAPAYRPPTLRHYGPISAVTKGSGTKGSDGSTGHNRP